MYYANYPPPFRPNSSVLCSFINAFVYNSVDLEIHMAANLVTETIVLRDHVFYFLNGFSMSHGELNDIINYICLS